MPLNVINDGVCANHESVVRRIDALEERMTEDARENRKVLSEIHGRVTEVGTSLATLAGTLAGQAQARSSGKQNVGLWIAAIAALFTGINIAVAIATRHGG